MRDVKLTSDTALAKRFFGFCGNALLSQRRRLSSLLTFVMKLDNHFANNEPLILFPVPNIKVIASIT